MLEAHKFVQETERSLSAEELLLGPQLIEALQSLFSPDFDWAFIAMTMLGSEEVLVGLSAVVYWCFDKPRGRLITYILLLGAYLNYFVKLLIPWPRPPVELRIVEKSETSLGFPSGHAQDSTTFWALLSLNFRRRILAVTGAVVVLMVGISRVYLGMHYPAQVIGGWIIGLAVAGLGMFALRYFPPRGKEVRCVPQMLFAVAMLVPVAVAVSIDPNGGVNAARIAGYIFGFSLGALAEDRFVDFTVNVSTMQRIVRVAIGGALTGVLVLAMGPVLPDTYLVPGFVNSVIRGLFVVLIVPVVFRLIERR